MGTHLFTMASIYMERERTQPSERLLQSLENEVEKDTRNGKTPTNAHGLGELIV